MIISIPKEFLTGESVSNGYITKYTGKFYNNRIAAIKEIMHEKYDGGGVLHSLRFSLVYSNN